MKLEYQIKEQNDHTFSVQWKDFYSISWNSFDKFKNHAEALRFLTIITKEDEDFRVHQLARDIGKI